MKILDCTLRDGGYYTSWDFDQKLVDTYISSFNNLPIDFIEVGYRSNTMDGYYGKYFYCPLNVLEDLNSKSDKKLAIILNEKDVRPHHAYELLKPIVDFVQMIRIAIDPKNFNRALLLAETVKKIGFEVAFNVMYMSSWSEQKHFLDQIKNVNGIADYFYMVDSYGGVYPKDVEATIDLVRSKTDVKLGFHGHNNLELGLINTLTAIDHGVDIVDATVTGMGRGAGNLKTELLLTALNSRGELNFPYNELTKSVDAFSELQKIHEWGTNLPYMVSGANSLPQKDVMEWVSKRYYSYNSIIRALDNQSKGKKDNQKLPILNFSKESSYEEVLIIGGGPTVIQHEEALKAYLKSNPSTLLIHASSKNAYPYKELENDQYFCLVGNEGHRLENVYGQVPLKGKGVLPPYPRKMGTYIPKILEQNAYELGAIDFTNVFQDSHTALAIQSAIELGIENILTAGYDGYSGSNIGEKEQELFFENEYLFSKALSKGLKLTSVTPTKYSNLAPKSIYSFL